MRIHNKNRANKRSKNKIKLESGLNRILPTTILKSADKHKPQTTSLFLNKQDNLIRK